nr:MULTISPECIES: hypothetical protein [unclassified Bradyrhizobium]
MVRSQPNGEISYDHLAQEAARERPAVVVANIGTTMKEGRDDTLKIRAVLRDVGIDAIYVHSDAALCGAYAALLSPRPHSSSRMERTRLRSADISSLARQGPAVSFSSVKFMLSVSSVLSITSGASTRP